jgi:hypothetical protein
MPRTSPASFRGICADAKGILAPTRICLTTLKVVARMKPIRQVEVARLMLAADCYDTAYALALLGGTEESLLNGWRSYPRIPMGAKQRNVVSCEISTLADQLGKLKLTGTDLVTLLISCLYAERLLANQRIKKYLERNWPEIYRDLEDVIREAGQPDKIGET